MKGVALRHGVCHMIDEHQHLIAFALDQEERVAGNDHERQQSNEYYRGRQRLLP